MSAPVVPEWPDDRCWVRATMVMSLDGSMVDGDGRSGGISTPEDHAMFLALRRSADVVLVGAQTVRAERYDVQRQPIAIVSASGTLPQDLPMLHWQREGGVRPLLYTTDQAMRRGLIDPRVAAVNCGNDMLDLGAVVADLNRRGWQRICCEGGPTLLRGLLDAGLLDELCLSIVAAFMGAATPIVAPGLRSDAFRVASAHALGRTTFLRLTAGRADTRVPPA